MAASEGVDGGVVPVAREVSLQIGQDTTFIRKGSVLAIRARHYIY